MAILLTGGLGYIGSHTAVELLRQGYEVVVVDNLYNSKIEVVDKIKQITSKDIKFYKEDLLNEKGIEEIFEKEKIDVVIHFAGLKAVGESVKEPLKYFENNIAGTINLLKVMKKFGVKNLVFSSSATVYGQPKKLPIKETFKTQVTNPYGRTKLFIEQILEDVYNADNSLNIICLRYFNPIGADASGLIGEDSNGIPNNLMPYITRVATGKLSHLNIFGDDYPTKDGTGVRDYIHVVDLAKGHTKAVERLDKNKGYEVFNLGTGKGYSVLEIVNTFNSICGNKVSYKIVERRSGDIAICYASSEKAKKHLNWEAKLGLEDMCKSSYYFETKIDKE